MGWPEVVVPLVGMVTTLIGTFAGIFAGIRTERERWEKEQLTRFHPDRYAKYIELLKNADKVIRTPFDTPEVAELLEAMNESYAHIQMLSSKPVREAAEAFYRISFDARFGRLEGSGVVPLEDRMNHINHSREAIVEAARIELGITSENLL